MMMPLRSVELRPGWRVMERYCDGCGVANASFGSGSLHDVLRTKDPGKIKVWCGPGGCRHEQRERANG